MFLVEWVYISVFGPATAFFLTVIIVALIRGKTMIIHPQWALMGFMGSVFMVAVAISSIRDEKRKMREDQHLEDLASGLDRQVRSSKAGPFPLP